MQILEQLASGYCAGRVAEQDIFMECASIMGYLEGCLQFSEVLTESVVMEGIDIKGMLKKAFGFVIGLFKKAKQLWLKLINFLRGRKGKAKPAKSDGSNSNEPNSLGQNSGTNNSHTVTPNATNVGNTQARIGMNDIDRAKDIDRRLKKDLDNIRAEQRKRYVSASPDPRPSEPVEKMRPVEKTVDDRLKEFPYSGLHPNAINSTMNQVINFGSQFYDRVVKLDDSIITELYDVIHRPYSRLAKKFHADFTNDDMGSSLSKEVFSNPNKIAEYIANTRGESGWDSLKGKINSPGDFKNVPKLMYEDKRNNSALRDYDKECFDRERFDYFVERYNVAVNNHDVKVNYASEAISRSTKSLTKLIDRCDELLKEVDKINDIDVETATKYIKQVQVISNLSIQCSSQYSMGLTEFCTIVEADLSKIGAYIASVQSKIPELMQKKK